MWSGIFARHGYDYPVVHDSARTYRCDLAGTKCTDGFLSALSACRIVQAWMRQNLADQRRLGRKIRTLRLRAKLTQEALAELASTSSKHIGDIERGNVDVGFGVLTRIARAFSVDIAVLAGWPVKTAGKALLTAEQKTQIDQTIQLLQRLLLLGS